MIFLYMTGGVSHVESFDPKPKLFADHGKTITVDQKLDPSLLGGVVTQVGTYVFDGSVKSQLERMRGALRS